MVFSCGWKIGVIRRILSGEIMLTLEEYVTKKKTAYNKILEILVDDSNDNVVYDLHRQDRRDSGLIVSGGVFKKYENLQKEINEQIEFMTFADEVGEPDSKYCWFVINKYCLENGEYKKILSCHVSFDGELLYYSSNGDTIKEIDIPESRNVIKPYNTGDILKVRNTPLTGELYVIYIYDEKREGNKHIQMIFDEEIEFYKINWLEITEKVENCPIEQINEMSKKIKENYDEFNKFFEKQKICQFIHSKTYNNWRKIWK